MKIGSLIGGKARTCDDQATGRVRRRIGGGALFAIACGVLFVILYGSVLTGRRVMVGGDILYEFAPWAGTPGAHPAHNPWVSDGITQFLPWLVVIRQSFMAGRLPLWNPYALFGTPLLGNGQAAPFSPFTLLAVLVGGAWGMSLAMLAKLWVAGVGLALYLRCLRVGWLGAALGGLAFAASSFMIVWLHGQGSAVAALMPWVFAGVEYYVQAPSGRRLALLGLAIGLQFLGGQPDASLYLCVGVALYGIVRCTKRGNRSALPGLAAAAVVGVLVASVQLLPFAAVLKESGALGTRAAEKLGLQSLPLTYLDSWLVPNIHGNPGIDGAIGRATNYNEGTGFAGVTALTLAMPGLIFQWRRDRSTMSALVLVGLVSVSIAYGLLTPVVGRLPGFASAPSNRMTMLTCFVVAALGGIGFDGLVQRHRGGASRLGLVSSVVGLEAVGAVVVGALLLVHYGARVDLLGPALPHGWITFWLVFGAACLVGAAGLATAAWFGMRRTAASGLTLLALVEAAVFAVPFQPQLPSSEVPPPSAAMDWLVAHAGTRTIAAQGDAISGETAALYGLHDATGYERTQSDRVNIFWSQADPSYGQGLAEPGAEWLAAAGVSYFMTHGSSFLPGTVPVYRAEGVTISRVPDARPFAFAASAVGWVASPRQAARRMAADPLGTVYLEGSGTSEAGNATVTVVSRQAGNVDLEVNAARSAEVVILQSYAPGWKATVDGHRTGILAADVLFQAVRVPAGRHQVSLVYWPSSVPIGIGLTGAGLLLVVLFLLFDPDLSALGRSKRRREAGRLRSAEVVSAGANRAAQDHLV